MQKHVFFVIAILFSVVSPTSLKATGTEESESIEGKVQWDAAVAAADLGDTKTTLAEVARRDGGAVGMVLEAQGGGYTEPKGIMGFTPMVGGSVYAGAWGANIRNQHTLGLALDFPMSRYFSMELEGGFAQYRVAYQHQGQAPVGYMFYTALLGANAKVYLSSSRIRPYFGLGMQGLYYDRLSRLNGDQSRTNYAHLVGAATVLVGLDFEVADWISFGARAGYSLPLVNKPVTANIAEGGQLLAAPGFEEAGIINSGFYKVLGTVTLRL